MSSIKNEDITLDEYEESFKIEVTTGIDEALNTYNKLKSEESTETDEQQQYR
jgi:hypothetical protein